MKLLSRRSVTTGLAAAVTALSIGPTVAGKNDPRERVKHLASELQKAMRECYPEARIVTLASGEVEGINPYLLLVAQLPNGYQS